MVILVQFLINPRYEFDFCWCGCGFDFCAWVWFDWNCGSIGGGFEMDIVHVCVLEIERRVSGLRTWIMDDGGYGSRRR